MVYTALLRHMQDESGMHPVDMLLKRGKDFCYLTKLNPAAYPLP